MTGFTFHTATAARGTRVAHLGVTTLYTRTDGSTTSDRSFLCGATVHYLASFSPAMEREQALDAVTCPQCLRRQAMFDARRSA